MVIVNSDLIKCKKSNDSISDQDMSAFLDWNTFDIIGAIVELVEFLLLEYQKLHFSLRSSVVTENVFLKILRDVKGKYYFYGKFF